MNTFTFQRNVIVIVDQVKFHCDAAVLVEQSGYFKNIVANLYFWNQNSNDQAIVELNELKEVTANTFAIINKYLETKELNLTVVNVGAVETAATYLDMPELQKMCRCYISENPIPEDALGSNLNDKTTEKLEINGNSHSDLKDNPQPKKKFKCQICHKVFSWKSHVNTHMRTHAEQKPFQCQVCQKKFVQRVHLNNHMTNHTGQKPYQCQICHKAFARKSALPIHERIHTGQKPFQCQICHRLFARKYHLSTHMATHTDNKPFQCQICSRAFAVKDYLTTHMRIHTGHKPFQCQICLKSFIQKGELNSHMRTHTGHKPFQCQICQKSFGRRGNLNTHMRTHTGHKPFQCQICCRTYAHKSSLNHHITIVHSGQSDKPENLLNN